MVFRYRNGFCGLWSWRTSVPYEAGRERENKALVSRLLSASFQLTRRLLALPLSLLADEVLCLQAVPQTAMLDLFASSLSQIRLNCNYMRSIS